MSILIVEDHDALREATIDFLSLVGHAVTGISCAEDLGNIEDHRLPELYIIDLNLPGEDGIALTRRIRAHHPEVGIIITTANKLARDKVVGYDSGADIYLTKPLDPEELVASVAALSRRLRPTGRATPGTLYVDVRALQASGPQGTVALTQSEVRLIDALAKAPECTLERWQIATTLGMNLDSPSFSSLEVRITNLRKKLLACGMPMPCIKALRNVGYKLCVPVEIVGIT